MPAMMRNTTMRKMGTVIRVSGANLPNPSTVFCNASSLRPLGLSSINLFWNGSMRYERVVVTTVTRTKGFHHVSPASMRANTLNGSAKMSTIDERKPPFGSCAAGSAAPGTCIFCWLSAIADPPCERTYLPAGLHESAPRGDLNN